MSILTLSKTKSAVIRNQAPVPRKSKVKPKNKPRTKQKSSKEKKMISRWRVVKHLVDWSARLFVITALGYGGWHAYHFVTTSSYFAIANVVYEGERVVEKQQLQRWTRKTVGKNIFTLDLPALSQQISQHPWVRYVSVARKFPNQLHISLEERKPYARIQLNKTYIMDDYGVLIAEARKEDQHLPMITGIREKRPEIGKAIQVEGILPGLKAMYYLNRLNFFREDPVDHFQMKGYDKLIFTSRHRGLKVRMTIDRVEQGYKNFKTFLNAVDVPLEGIQSIDLSFLNKVVVFPQPQIHTDRIQRRS